MCVSSSPPPRPPQGQAVDQDQFSQQDPSMLLDQKPPMYGQQFAPPPHMGQRGYAGAPMQEPSFHPMAGAMGGGPMGPRPGYPMLRMQTRPGLRPAGGGPPQPNTLRLQLQHRLQSQQLEAMLSIDPVYSLCDAPLRLRADPNAARLREQRLPVSSVCSTTEPPTDDQSMSGVSNVNLPLRASAPNQGTINAQMLAQRQRELLSNHLRQRQVQQAQQMMMGGQYGAVLTPQMQHSAFQFPNSGMSQQADGGFGGPGAAQSPMLSPRMSHAQSPMMQQAQAGAAFQGSPDMNGWPQGNMAGSSLDRAQKIKSEPVHVLSEPGPTRHVNCKDEPGPHM
ncbi:unnamed protein product [Boreogadus saida]